MCNIGKSYTLVLIFLVVAINMIAIESVPLVLAQSGTKLSGIINSDMTWTASNSPYYLTEDTKIKNGVTLTIESGAEINLNGKTLEVDGALRVLGTANNPIPFITSSTTDEEHSYGISPNAGMIFFTDTSKSYDQKTQSGSIIQYANFGSYASCGITVRIQSSPKITNNHLNIGVITTYGDSTIISNNQFFGGAINVGGGSPTIMNNTLLIGGGGEEFAGGSGINIWGKNNALVGDNSVYINLTSDETNAIGIMIGSGSPIIAKNFVINNDLIPKPVTGILVYSNANPLIENNTIEKNSLGINIYDSFGSPTPSILYNNFEQNRFNIYLGQESNPNSTVGDVNATNNWWGTTNQQTISQLIYDFKNNNKVGTVNFVPFLTSPNLQALPNPSEILPTPSPSVPEFSWLVLIPLITYMLLVAVTLRHRKTAILSK